MWTLVFRSFEFFTNFPQYKNANIANFVSAVLTGPIFSVTLKYNPHTSLDFLFHIY